MNYIICQSKSFVYSFLQYLILYFLLSWLPLPRIQAQPIFSPGGIIKINGDTLQGWIGETSNNRNYSECIFRTKGNNQRQVFKPNEIRGYYIENRRYFESRTIPLANGDLIEVFVEFVVHGKISLLQVEKNYYLLDDKGELRSVPFEYNYRFANYSQSALEELWSQWLRFLNDISLDCPAMSIFFDTRENLSYEEENLVLIVRTYNECKNGQYVEYGADLPSTVVDVGTAVSTNFTNISFSADFPPEYRYLVGSDFQDWGIEFGLPVYIRSMRRLTNVGLYVEPLIRYYNLRRNFLFLPDLRPDAIYYDYSAQWLSVGTPLALRYTIPNKTPYISFQMGIRLEFMLNHKSQLVIEEIVTENGIDYITSARRRPFELADSQFGLTGQINVTDTWLSLAGRWEVSLGFNVGSGITEFDNTSAVNSSSISSRTGTLFLKTAILW